MRKEILVEILLTLHYYNYRVNALLRYLVLFAIFISKIITSNKSHPALTRIELNLQFLHKENINLNSSC